MATELARRVGDTGRVEAVDLVTRFLDDLPANVTVRAANLATEPVDTDGTGFDLIHGRAVLVHIPERDEVLDRLIAALRPGGVIFLEEPSFGSGERDQPALDPDRFAVWTDVLALLKSTLNATGSDPVSFPVRMAAMLAGRSLTVEIAERHATLPGPDSAMTSLWEETMRLLRPQVVAAGIATEEQAASALAMLTDPTFFGEVFAFEEVVARRPRK